MEPATSPRTKRRVVQALVIAVGLSLGAGGVLALTGDDGGRRSEPSVKDLGLAAAPRAPLPPPDAAVTFAEPTSAQAAVEQFLTAESSGRSELSFALLRAKDRKNLAVLASWVQTKANRPVPTSFRVEEVRGAAAGSTDVIVEVRRAPLLDPFSGFVPAVATETWNSAQEDGKWRVRAEPTDSFPVLPDDNTVGAAAARWLDAARSCDAAALRAEQVNDDLLGSRLLASMPCRDKGAWRPGAVESFESTGDTTDARSLAATFGPEIAGWARIVLLDGPADDFYVALAPLGPRWQVFALLAADGKG